MAGLSPASRLDELAILSRDLLYVFVAGPGYGEGIAVAFPERGWLMVDGCQVVDGRLQLTWIRFKPGQPGREPA